MSDGTRSARKKLNTLKKMEKETLLRLAQPAATFALALSIATLPMTG